MRAIKWLENTFVEIAGALGPWLTPIPTAFLVGRALYVHLEYPVAIAVIGALVIELLGLSSTNEALRFYEYNQRKRDNETPAPLWIAALLVAFYFGAATGLTVLLDLRPALAIYAPVLFPLLSLTGVGVLALRADHRRREAAQAERAAEEKARKEMAAERRRATYKRKAARKAARKGKRKAFDIDSAPETAKEIEDIKSTPNKPELGTEQRRAHLQGLVKEGEEISPTALSRRFGVSRQTIYNDLEVLGENGSRKP